MTLKFLCFRVIQSVDRSIAKFALSAISGVSEQSPEGPFLVKSSLNTCILIGRRSQSSSPRCIFMRRRGVRTAFCLRRFSRRAKRTLYLVKMQSNRTLFFAPAGLRAPPGVPKRPLGACFPCGLQWFRRPCRKTFSPLV